MAFRLTEEQLKTLGKQKIIEKPKKLEKEVIGMGVSKNNKPYLVIGAATFYVHQAKGLLKALKDERFSVAKLEEYVDYMIKYRQTEF